MAKKSNKLKTHITNIKALLESASKANITQVADNAIQNTDYLDELVTLSFTQEAPYAWRAAWALRHICAKNQDTLRPYLPIFIQKIGNIKHHSQLGGFLFVLSQTDDIIFGEDAGQLVNICYREFGSIKNPYYIKLYCVDLLYKISQQYPPLKNELLLTLELRIKQFQVNHSQKKALDLIKKLRKEVKKMNI